MSEILVAYDDSPAARAALRWGISYACERDRSVRLLYVLSSLSEWELAAIQVDTNPIRARFAHLLRNEWSQLLRDAAVEYTTELAVGRPADVILETARHHAAELIVLGMTQRGLLHEVVLGAIVRHVVHEALRPVVAVPRGWGEDPDAR
jgi:nucleotide-binding universal stress UspA family protein